MRDFEAMKGIDYEETNTYRAFYLFDTPIRKIGFCPERDSNPRDFSDGCVEKVKCTVCVSLFVVLSPLEVFQLMKVVDALLAQWPSSLMNLTQRNKGAFDLADCLELFLNGQKVSLCKVTSRVVCRSYLRAHSNGTGEIGKRV